MLLEDVLSNFPIVTADAVVIGYRPSDDREWEISWVNDAFCTMFKADRLDTLGRHPETIHHPDYLLDFKEHIVEMYASERTHLTIGTRCMCRDGTEFWASLSLFIIFDEEGEGRHCVLNIRDINDLKDREQAAELALIENEQLLNKVEAAQTRLISAIETSSDPFAIFDARDKLVIWNPSYALTLTDDPSELKKGMKLEAVLRLGAKKGRFPDAVGQIDAWIEKSLKNWNDPDLNEFRIQANGGVYKVVSTRAVNGDRVLLQTDISEFLSQQRELKRYAERLEHSNQEFSYQAFHDELTGLGNRRYLNMKLEEMTDARERNGGEIATLHVDLDRFKQVNDTMGHAAGDHVLEVVSERLQRVLRSTDIVARTGGDEFVVLIACNIDSQDPEKVGHRLIEEMAKPVTFEGRPCIFGASVGIARTPLIDTDELLTSSDIALYKAKTEGRGRVGIFDSSDLEQLRSVKNLGSDIRRGLENDEFLPVYLPEIDPETGQVASLTVSAQWQHPERGLLTSDDFLNSADDIQMRGEIDKVIFDRATADCLREFRAGACPMLSFSISHARFIHEDLSSDIAASATSVGIGLELNETIFLEDESVAFLRSIEDLRQVGACFVVNAFGSGKGSLVALRRLSPSRLKIDPRLIEPIAQSVSTLQMVRSIAGMGRAMNIGVTAAGVTTDEQAKVLHGTGCDRQQGALYGAPMGFKDLIAYLNQRAHWTHSA